MEPIKISESQDSEVLLSSLITNFEILPVEESEGAIPYIPEKIIGHNQSYFILDRTGSKKVVHFDSNTLKSEVVGNSGKGPGEYLMPGDIYLDRLNNELIILDRMLRKLIYYSLNDLDVIREQKLSFSASRFIKDDGFFYFLGSGTDKKIIVTDDSLSTVNKLIDDDVRHHFKALNSFYKIENKIIYHAPFSPQFYTFQNGIRVNGRSIQFKSDNLTNEVYKSFPDFKGNYESFTSMAENYQTNFAAIEETKELIYFICKYNQTTSIVFYDKMTGQSLTLPYTSFKNDLTFEESVKIIGRDNDGYFLNFVPLSNSQKEKIINAMPHQETNLKKAEAFLIRFKIDIKKMEKFTKNVQ